MGVTWYTQPRDNISGRWYTNNPRFFDMHLRLSSDERNDIEKWRRN